MQKIIGESSSLSTALDHVSLIAPVSRPVLICGERGSGKELIAERIHYLSSRWDQDFHKVNCAAISESLLESDLFGHEAGAFTGAQKTHIGRFERADGGTLFLDELGTMPMRIQEKLLRLIEYGEFERLGGQRTIKVDIRILAATNANLPKLAEEGEFRHDLLDRLAFDVIQVPPLRERGEDIPTLVDFFATRMVIELGWDYYSGFSHRAMDRFIHYHWPGNIRELKNAVERSICRWQDKDSPVDQVVLNPFATQSESATDLSLTQTASDHQESELQQSFPIKNFKQQIHKLEISLLQNALQQNQFRQNDTAKALALSYHQLRGLLKKHKNVLQLTHEKNVQKRFDEQNKE
ncbi:Psp operon transcriptional activator [Thalassocella blandensis]|nr:Psp operon transcriptional activator [Thalassocella blandensis]